MNTRFRETFGASAVDFSQLSAAIGNSFISLGSRTLNYHITGNPEVGVVKRRIYEIFGPEGCGKTTLDLEAIANCQKKGGKVLMVDAEHALDQTYATAIGVDLDKLELGEPDCGEEALEMVEWGIDENYDLVVVDSVAALSPRAELEGDVGDSNIGLLARLMGRGLRRITSMLKSDVNTGIIFINQMREKVGVMFGNPETQPGGRALKHFAAVRIDLRDPRGQKVLEVNIEIGKRINAKTVKNKLAAPFQKCTVHLSYGKGVDKAKDILQIMSDVGVVTVNKTFKIIKINGMQQMNFSTFLQKMRKDKKFLDKVKGTLIEGVKK